MERARKREDDEACERTAEAVDVESRGSPSPSPLP